MSFILSEVHDTAEFDAIWPILFQAFRNPYNSFSKFFNPVHTTLDAAIEISKARHIAMLKGNPASHWVKVTESSSDQVVGAALWDVNEKGYAEGDGAKFKASFRATQHVEGSEEKLFAEKLIGGLRSAVLDNIREPHVELKQMIVHPEHRRLGVAKMLADWGLHIADERGIEAVVVSVPYAQPMYEKLGFKIIEDINIDFSTPHPSHKWKEWENEDTRAFLMVKPANNKL